MRARELRSSSTVSLRSQRAAGSEGLLVKVVEVIPSSLTASSISLRAASAGMPSLLAVRVSGHADAETISERITAASADERARRMRPCRGERPRTPRARNIRTMAILARRSVDDVQVADPCTILTILYVDKGFAAGAHHARDSRSGHRDGISRARSRLPARVHP